MMTEQDVYVDWAYILLLKIIIKVVDRALTVQVARELVSLSKAWQPEAVIGVIVINP